MFAPKRILVPTDFSEYSDEALKQALELAKQFNAKVYLLHVASPITQCAADYCLDTAKVKMVEEAEMLRAKGKMLEALKKFPDSQEVDIISDVREGEPVAEILKQQEENGIDLIVMSSHGKTGFVKRLLGQVSERVMEETKSPVLVVRH